MVVSGAATAKACGSSVVENFIKEHGNERVLDHIGSYLHKPGLLHANLVRALKSVADKFYGGNGVTALEEQIRRTAVFVNAVHMKLLCNPDAIEGVLPVLLAAKERGVGSVVMLSTTVIPLRTEGDLSFGITGTVKLASGEPVHVTFPLVSSKERGKIIRDVPAVSAASIAKLKADAAGHVAAAVFKDLDEFNTPEYLGFIKDAFKNGNRWQLVWDKLIKMRGVGKGESERVGQEHLDDALKARFQEKYEALRIQKKDLERQAAGLIDNWFSGGPSSNFVAQIIDINIRYTRQVKEKHDLPEVFLLPMDEVVMHVLKASLTEKDQDDPIFRIFGDTGNLQKLMEMFRGESPVLFHSVRDGKRQEKGDTNIPGEILLGLNNDTLVPTTFTRHMIFMLLGSDLVDGSHQANYHARWKEVLRNHPDLHPRCFENMGRNMIKLPIAQVAWPKDLLECSREQVDRVSHQLQHSTVAEAEGGLIAGSEGDRIRSLPTLQ